MNTLAMKQKTSILFLFFISVVIINSCTKVKGELDFTSQGYPQEVGEIISNKCATGGCHNDQSKEAAGGLSLLTWDKMFEGSRGGAVVIPYRPDYSTLIYYTNTYDDIGLLQLTPVMPYNSAKLTHEEVQKLNDWILQGAPNAQGLVKFSGENRKMVYAGNQGCDEVTVFDAQSMIAMRYVKVGTTPGIEGPHMVKVAPNNQFWCTSFIAGQYFQKFSTANNALLGQVNIGFGSWNTFVISSDSKKAYVIDWSPSGKIAAVNLENMTAEVTGGFSFPHGSALNATDNILYVTAQTGNFIYKLPVDDFGSYEQISMDNNPPSSIGSLNIHEIHFSPDFSKYFVTCQNTNEIRVIQTSNDSLLAVISVGVFPQEMGVSSSYPYLFVTCTEDDVTFPGKRSSVYVIDYNNHSVIKSLYLGHQSHGVAVDETNKKVFISNRNVTTGGPAPHHSSLCSGRNGYVTAIDIPSLNVVPDFKAEVSVDPYGLGITH